MGDIADVKPELCKSFTDIHAVFTIGPQLRENSYSTVHAATRNVKTDEGGPLHGSPAGSEMVGIRFIPKRRKGIVHAVREEISILNGLNHPNLLSIREVLESEMEVYLVSDLCDGGNLFDRVVQGRVATERLAAAVFRQILAAVKHMHDNNVIHRDLKPQTVVFLNEREPVRIKLTDFGTAIRFKPKDPNAKDAPLMDKQVGTVKYMAPEMVSHKEYDFKVDLWSLGVILYFILSGSEPFNGQGAALHEAIREGKYGFPSPHWDPVGPGPRDLVTRLLKRDPAARPPIAEACRHAWVYLEKDRLFDVIVAAEKAAAEKAAVLAAAATGPPIDPWAPVPKNQRHRNNNNPATAPQKSAAPATPKFSAKTKWHVGIAAVRFALALMWAAANPTPKTGGDAPLCNCSAALEQHQTGGGGGGPGFKPYRVTRMAPGQIRKSSLHPMENNMGRSRSPNPSSNSSPFEHHPTSPSTSSLSSASHHRSPTGFCCSRCGDGIDTGEEVVQVADHLYHASCFLCNSCGTPLNRSYVEGPDGFPYHPSCLSSTLYSTSGSPPSSPQGRGALSGPSTLCFLCQRPCASGPILCGHKYHEQCLKCSICGIQIVDEVNFENEAGEVYHKRCLEKLRAQQGGVRHLTIPSANGRATSPSGRTPSPMRQPAILHSVNPSANTTASSSSSGNRTSGGRPGGGRNSDPTSPMYAGPLRATANFDDLDHGRTGSGGMVRPTPPSSQKQPPGHTLSPQRHRLAGSSSSNSLPQASPMTPSSVHSALSNHSERVGSAGGNRRVSFGDTTTLAGTGGPGFNPTHFSGATSPTSPSTALPSMLPHAEHAQVLDLRVDKAWSGGGGGGGSHGLTSKFCHACGHKYATPLARFCADCGEPRIV